MVFLHKKDGFKDEKLIVVPTNFFSSYQDNAFIQMLSITDIGYFPQAKFHFRERSRGLDEFILIYCIGGQGIIRLADKSIHLSNGKIFCIPNNTGHQYYADLDDPWSILWVHFKGRHSEYFPLTEKRIIDLETPHENHCLQSLFALLIEVCERNFNLGNFIYASQLLSVILADIFYKEKATYDDKENRRLSESIRFMIKHINTEISLDQIAEQMRLSKSYVNLIFKKCTHHSPIDFFIQLKMREACKYLRMSNMMVYEVAERVGYSDPGYFSRIFKKIMGISPRSYQKGIGREPILPDAVNKKSTLSS